MSAKQLAVKFFMPVYSYFKRNIATIIGLVIMCLFVSLISPKFFSWSNFTNVCRQISTNCFIACGMTFCILIGGIDLSVGPVLAFAGALSAFLMETTTLPIWFVIIITISLCSLVGLFNGIVIAETEIAPFIVTLSTQQIVRGFALLLGTGMPIYILNEDFINIGVAKLGDFSLPVYYAGVFFILCCILLNKTKFGRCIYAIGGNRTAARFAGINVKSKEIMVYTLSSFLAGIAGIVLAARLSCGNPSTGEGYECDAIAAVVLGGASFSGGVGTLGGTLLGCCMIGIINNGMNMLNVTSFWQNVAKGLVILAAVMLDVIRKKNSEKRILQAKT